MKLAYIDSCIWITRIEGLSRYRSLINSALQELIADGWSFAYSDAVVLEVLLKPLQNNQGTIVQKYQSLFATIKPYESYPNIFKDALHVAQKEALKTMDAVHVALAAHYKCTLFVSSDPPFRHLKTISPYWIDLREQHQ